MSLASDTVPLTETIAPAEEAEVAEVIRRAGSEGRAVYPLGGGTAPDFGRQPQKPGIGLSLRRMNRIVEHAVADLTVTVEAGVTIDQLQQCLRAEKQRLPLDVPQGDRATVGGLLATALAGPRGFAYGTIRDYLLGLRAVDGRGRVFSSGGRVVKNAAGYNLGRLLVGSLGTLGVITQATLLVRPLPEATAAVACDLPDFETAERLLADLLQAPVLPVAVELLCGPDSQHNPAFGPMLESSVAQLIVGFEATEAEVHWMVEQLTGRWHQAGITSPATAFGEALEAMWLWLSGLGTDLQASVRPGAAVGLLERLRQLDPNGSIEAQAGNGVLRIHLSPRMPEEFTTLLRRKLRPAVESAGGNLVVLSAPTGAALSCEEVWGPRGESLALMQALKDRFDPDGILNPDRSLF